MGDLTDRMNAKMDAPAHFAPAQMAEPYTDTKRALRRAVALLEGVRDGLQGSIPRAVATLDRELPALRAEADK
jgi:hypothetical protein